jgi:hypothetical protein
MTQISDSGKAQGLARMSIVWDYLLSGKAPSEYAAYYMVNNVVTAEELDRWADACLQAVAVIETEEVSS